MLIKIQYVYNDQIFKEEVYDLNSFNKDKVTFGKSTTCDIVLDIKFARGVANRVHGGFIKWQGDWWIIDNQSHQGISCYESADGLNDFDIDIKRFETASRIQHGKMKGHVYLIKPRDTYHYTIKIFTVEE